jgi:hypothetical protein
VGLAGWPKKNKKHKKQKPAKRVEKLRKTGDRKPWNNRFFARFCTAQATKE